MKKYKEFFKFIADKPLSFALLSNIFWLALALLGFRPFFRDDFDLEMSLLTEGVYGIYDGHLNKTNAALGFFEAFLGRIIPNIRWHVFFQYLFVFLMLVLLTFFLAHFRNGRVAATLVQISCFYELYVALQSFEVAVFLSVAGLIIILSIARQKIIEKKHDESGIYKDMFRKSIGKGAKTALLALACVCVIYAQLLRMDAFLMASAFVLVFAIFDCTRMILRYDYKVAGRYMVSIIPVIVSAVLLFAANVAIYDSNTDWNYYHHYKAENETKSETESDYIPGYEVEDDYARKMYDAISNPTPEMVMAVVAVGTVLTISATFSGAFWMGILQFALCIGAGIFRIVFVDDGPELLSAVFVAPLIILITVMTTGDVKWFGLKGQKRQELPIRLKTALTVPVIILILLVLICRAENEYDYIEYKENGNDFAVLQMYMEQEKDLLFVADVNTVKQKYKYNVFRSLNFGALDNFVTTDRMMQESPIYRAILDKYGYVDVADALRSGSENVILIDNVCPDEKAAYFTRMINGPRYAADYVDNICGYDLYRIR